MSYRGTTRVLESIGEIHLGEYILSLSLSLCFRETNYGTRDDEYGRRRTEEKVAVMDESSISSL